MNFKNSYNTYSVCPICLKKIPAKRITTEKETVLLKKCTEHGTFKTPIWRGEPDISLWSKPKIPSTPPVINDKAGDNCPFECGLCKSHNQHTCTALLEITNKCDLNCSVCFASAGEKNSKHLSIEKIKWLLNKTFATAKGCNLQLSGGEPTTHPELEKIITMAKDIGFEFVQLNTNGLKIAKDPDYAKKLKKCGLDSVFLQFDGTSDHIYKKIRNANLFKTKQKTVENLAQANIGIVLVPTIIPSVNDHNLGEIINFAISNMPHIRGVHFQPVSYFGRCDKTPSNSSRITLPEVMAKLEAQTNGKILKTDFIPPSCEHSLCSFHANYLLTENGQLKKLSAKNNCNCKPQLAKEGANKAKKFVRKQWSAVEDNSKNMNELNDLDKFILRAKTHILAVSAMAFQDCFNLDLERLKGCCIHVVAPNGDLVPFCAYNLTSISGDTLYRNNYEN